MSFEKAIADSKKLTSKPSNEELLELYGAPVSEPSCLPPDHPTDSITAALFKIANGEDISKAPAPGMFDLKVRLPPAPSVQALAPRSSSWTPDDPKDLRTRRLSSRERISW